MSASHAKKLAASLTPAEKAARDRRLARAVRDGMTYAAAAKRFGIDARAVRLICEAMGVVPAKKERRDE